MWETLEKAWSGWLKFTDNGKLAVLFLALAGYLLLNSRQKGPQRRLVVYGSIGAVLCIFPVTAAVLMRYQTPFYDYQWIWSMVPFTSVIALGGTVFLTEHWRKGIGYHTLFFNTALTLLCAGTLVLCGGLGKNVVAAMRPAYVYGEDLDGTYSRTYVSAVLDTVCSKLYAADMAEVDLTDTADTTDTIDMSGRERGFCLWAPQEILEYARSERGDIRLLYGRNMWDAALDAYSYDSCSDEQRELYQWMEHLTDYERVVGDEEGQEYVERAFTLGADCVLLPIEIQGWNPAETVWEQGNVETFQLEQYYMLCLR